MPGAQSGPGARILPAPGRTQHPALRRLSTIVKCFSISTAPRATAATAARSLRLWSESPTEQPKAEGDQARAGSYLPHLPGIARRNAAARRRGIPPPQNSKRFLDIGQIRDARGDEYRTTGGRNSLQQRIVTDFEGGNLVGRAIQTLQQRNRPLVERRTEDRDAANRAATWNSVSVQPAGSAIFR